MPLIRAAGLPAVDLNDVAFPMQDTATGKGVSCRVSEDALRRLSGGSSIAALEDLFAQQRDLIEEIASNKYDLGQDPPLVVEDDV